MAKSRKWLKKTPWSRGLQFVYAKRGGSVSERELIYALLVFCGVPRSVAFGVAFPDSKAEGLSVAQLSSRLVNSYELRKVFSEWAKSEDYLEFRYPKDIEESKHPYGW